MAPTKIVTDPRRPAIDSTQVLIYLPDGGYQITDATAEEAPKIKFNAPRFTWKPVVEKPRKQ